MFFWLKKKDYNNLGEKFDNIHSSLHKSFLNVKMDVTHLIAKIDKINEDHIMKKSEIEELNKRVNQIEQIIDHMFNQKTRVFGQPFEVKQTNIGFKQPNSFIRTDNQMDRKGDKWTRNFTPMERTIINILLNTDMQLSYDDLSVMMGRDKSTIRGQMNNIKMKNELLVTEIVQKDGKKRFYVEDRLKSEILRERNMLIKANSK